MNARVLTTSEAREFLLRHPEILPEQIPSYGMRISEYLGGEIHDYLIGIVHATGEVKVVDVTAYENGRRIDPATAGVSYWQAILESLQETGGALDPFKTGTIGNQIVIIALILGGVWIWRKAKNSIKA